MMRTENLTNPAALLTPAQASVMLGVAVQTLAKWRHEGRGPRYLKMCRLIRYRRDELERWLSELERASTSEYGQR